MAVYKDEAKGTWRVIYRYTDWTGKPKQTQKRGFKTKREAQQWEWETMLKKECIAPDQHGILSSRDRGTCRP